MQEQRCLHGPVPPHLLVLREPIHNPRVLEVERHRYLGGHGRPGCIHDARAPRRLEVSMLVILVLPPQRGLRPLRHPILHARRVLVLVPLHDRRVPLF